MAVVTKKIGNNCYRYEQKSERVNGKVVTKSKYLGAVNPKRKRRDGFGFLLFGVASLGVAALKGELGRTYRDKPRPPDPRSPLSEREKRAAAAENTARLARSERALMNTPEFRHVRALNELLIGEEKRFQLHTSHNVRQAAGGWDTFHQLNAEYNTMMKNPPPAKTKFDDRAYKQAIVAQYADERVAAQQTERAVTTETPAEQEDSETADNGQATAVS